MKTVERYALSDFSWLRDRMSEDEWNMLQIQIGLEIAAAQRDAMAEHPDKARLDWLDEHKVSVEHTFDKHRGEFFTWSNTYNKPLYSKTVRGAIDKDMKQVKKKRVR